MTYVYRRDEPINRLPTAPYATLEIRPAEWAKPGPKPGEHKKPYDPTLCGSMNGYRQHRRFKEPQCPRCGDAYNEYQRGYRAGERKGKVR